MAYSFSVVIPLYNGERFIDRCFNSLVVQTIDDFEVVIVNDGSTDGSREIVGAWRDRFGDRLVYIEQENAGASAARNAAIRAAQGKYISFLDIDDEYDPRRLECYRERFEQNPEYGVLYSIPVGVDVDGREFSFYDVKRCVTPSGWVYRELWERLCVVLTTVACRRDLLEQVGAFDPKFKILEDCDLWLRLSLVTRFMFVDEMLSKNHYVPGSLSRGASHEILCFYRRQLCRKHHDNLRNNFSNPLIYQKFQSDALLDLAGRNLKSGDVNEACRNYVAGFVRYPFRFKPLFGMMKCVRVACLS